MAIVESMGITKTEQLEKKGIYPLMKFTSFSDNGEIIPVLNNYRNPDSICVYVISRMNYIVDPSELREPIHKFLQGYDIEKLRTDIEDTQKDMDEKIISEHIRKNKSMGESDIEELRKDLEKQHTFQKDDIIILGYEHEHTIIAQMII